MDKKESIGVDIYYVEYIAQTPDCLESLQPLYNLIKESFGFIEECDGNKYLNIAVAKNNEDLLLTYEEIWERIKEEIKKINDRKDGKYDKNYRKLSLIRMMNCH